MAFSTFEQLFAKIRLSQSPALIWYSVPGERIELSGKVLDNWISKTANFLVDECQVASGDHLGLVMGVHWRSILIALASWRIGAQVSFDLADFEGETAFSFEPQPLQDLGIDYPVLVDRGPLSPRYMGQLPADFTDYCAEVRSHGDVYSALELPEADSEAVEGLNYGQLLNRISQQTSHIEDAAQSLLLETEELSASYLTAVLAAIASGRGVVVLDPTLDWAEERLARIMADEKAEVMLVNPAQ